MYRLFLHRSVFHRGFLRNGSVFISLGSIFLLGLIIITLLRLLGLIAVTLLGLLGLVAVTLLGLLGLIAVILLRLLGLVAVTLLRLLGIAVLIIAVGLLGLAGSPGRTRGIQESQLEAVFLVGNGTKFGERAAQRRFNFINEGNGGNLTGKEHHHNIAHSQQRAQNTAHAHAGVHAETFCGNFRQHHEQKRQESNDGTGNQLDLIGEENSHDNQQNAGQQQQESLEKGGIEEPGAGNSIIIQSVEGQNQKKQVIQITDHQSREGDVFAFHTQSPFIMNVAIPGILPGTNYLHLS